MESIEQEAYKHQEQQSKAAEVFVPGSLTCGIDILDPKVLPQILQKGILPAKVHGYSGAVRPDAVCFSMNCYMSPPIQRYLAGCHYGPLSDSYKNRIGVIVDSQLLLARFPGRIKAVGEFFRMYRRIFTHDNEDPSTIYNIPITTLVPSDDKLFSEPFVDEVVLQYREGDSPVGVTPDLWRGIVVTSWDFKQVKSTLELMNINVPLLKPEE